AGREGGERARAAGAVGFCSSLHAALGELASAERDLVRVAELAKRAGHPGYVIVIRQIALFDVAYSRGVGLELGAPRVDATLARDHPALRHVAASMHSSAAVV